MRGFLADQQVQLQAGESGLGWLLAASGFGAVLGAMTVAVSGMIRRRGVVLTFAGVVFFLAIATYPTENTTSTIVANMKAAGAPTPWPKPTTIGVLNSIAEIGAEPVTVKNSTPTR